MQKKTKSRLPSCPRDPSRRLHPLPDVSTDRAESASTPNSFPQAEPSTASKTQDFETAGLEDVQVTSRAETVRRSGSNSLVSQSDSGSDYEEDLRVPTNPVVPVIGQNLFGPPRHFQQIQRPAMAAVRKFISPPTFRGSPTEDARQWLERYETISTHNGWGDADKRNNFSMYLDDTARNWFLCARLPNDWEDTAAQPAAGGNPATPVVLGFRSVFLKEFQPDNYGLFQESRLRSRKQGVDEPTIRYYYEILNLCRLVDLNMSETHRLEHLFRGLRPDLFRKIYPLKPRTCEEFLTLAKSYTEASLMSDTRGWKDTTSESQKHQEQLPNVAVVYPEQQADFMKSMRELIQETCEKLITKERGEQAKPRVHFKVNGRTANGRPQCFYCKKSGHIARSCFRNPESEQYRGPTRDAAPTSTGNLPINSAVQVLNPPERNLENSESYIFNVNSARLIREKVKCGQETAIALIDTGAAVTVITPELLQKTEFVKQPLTGSKIRLVNGQCLSPQGVADIVVTHRGKTLKGSALVMPMSGFELLLGNDFLQQFRAIHIDYESEESLFTTGKSSLAEICTLEAEEEQKENVLVSNGSQEIPAYSIRHIPATISNKMEGSCIVKPSESLLSTTSLSTGHALVQTDLENIPVANLSPKAAWLEKGVTLGTLEEYQESIVDEESKKILLMQDSVKKEDPEAEKKELLKNLDSRIGTNLSEKERGEIEKILEEFSHCFALNEDDLGLCSLVKHDINTGIAPAIHQLPYKSAWKERVVIQDQVEGMLRRGVIEPSDSPWSSPVVLVKKKDGTWRFCVDYRKLNAVTVKDSYPLPRIADTLSRLEGATLFSSMDLQSGYHQVPVVDEHRSKTAFVTADGLYQFRTLPFGLTNAPGTFQRAMDIILAGLRWTTCLIYLDDVIVYSATFQQHVERLRSVMSCLDQAGLKLKWSKCSFAEHTLKVLGHIITKEGVTPDPEKL